MPEGAKCRGFMFWSISFEGNAVYDGTGFTEMWLAKGLNKFLKLGLLETRTLQGSFDSYSNLQVWMLSDEGKRRVRSTLS